MLDLVYSDVCGPMKTKTLGGSLYFVTFIDDHSRKIWVYTLKTKDQVLDVFKQFHALVERQSGEKLKCIRIDNGGEYSGPFDEYCRQHGIRHQKTPPKTPQLNGLAERMNRTLVERVRCLLSQSQLPRSFWGEALNTVVHVLNLTPCVPLEFDVPDRIGQIMKSLMITCVSLDAMILCIFPKMRGLSLMLRQDLVYLLAMVRMSLVTGFMIRCRKNL